jgi:hypothetical protein
MQQGCRQAGRGFYSRRLHALNQESRNDLEKSEKLLGVSGGEYSKDGDCLSVTIAVSFFGPTMAHIAERWPILRSRRRR